MSDRVLALSSPTLTPSAGKDTILITGGAGFIGTNLADHLLRAGYAVILFDNLSRTGVVRNAAWLRQMHGARVTLIEADIRDAASVRACVLAYSGRLAGVFHFAAQVAVTTSVLDPIADFTVNAGGTLNLLEALRSLPVPPPVLFTSTNKVYGALADLPLSATPRGASSPTSDTDPRASDARIPPALRYMPTDPTLAERGLDETCPLDFQSPYGCSKGAADQYVLDYARTFGLPAAVFRMSCVYGPHQYGTEDQGWIAHFLIKALHGEPLIIYGDGCQVRDALFVEDLVRAMLLALAALSNGHASVRGQAFNIGGGPARTISLLELVELIAAVCNLRPRIGFAAWRSGDQRYYVSDTRKFGTATGWAPQVGLHQGVTRLYAWLRDQHSDTEVSRSNGKFGAVAEECAGIDPAPADLAPLGRHEPLPYALSAPRGSGHGRGSGGGAV